MADPKQQAAALSRIPNRAPHGKVLAKVYVHGNKESMWKRGEALGLTCEALRAFSFACYEIEVGLEVDLDTGESRIVTIDGREVAA